jgi:hypothetical protein
VITATDQLRQHWAQAPQRSQVLAAGIAATAVLAKRRAASAGASTPDATTEPVRLTTLTTIAPTGEED